MKITFLLPEATLSGGVRVVAIYADRLRQRGHEVVVISTPPRPTTSREALRRISRRQWPHRRIAPSHLDGLKIEHRRLKRCRPVRAVDVPESDVVVATWWETAEWVAQLPDRKGAKAYLVQHDERAMYPGPGADEKRERVMATWHLPMHRIVVAQWLADLLDEHVGPDSARVVPNGVDLELFRASARGKQARPTVGVMYATVPFKGCDLSLAAFEMARRQLADLQLITFGGEPIAGHLPLPRGVRYMRSPAQTRIVNAYASCDAWLFGSRCEGFGLPVLEAMACRTPVIAMPAGAAPELLADGGGIMVPPEDPRAMAEAIEVIAAMSDRGWRRMSDAALNTARRHDWKHSVDLFEAALMDAAASRATPAGCVVQR